MQSSEQREKEQLLKYMANRAVTRPYFLARTIEAYQERHQLDRVALTAWLGISDGQLTRLELCGQPDATEPGRSADVAALLIGSELTRPS